MMSESVLRINEVTYCGREYPVKNARWTQDGLAIEFYDEQAALTIWGMNNANPD